MCVVFSFAPGAALLSRATSGGAKMESQMLVCSDPLAALGQSWLSVLLCYRKRSAERSTVEAEDWHAYLFGDDGVEVWLVTLMTCNSKSYECSALSAQYQPPQGVRSPTVQLVAVEMTRGAPDALTYGTFDRSTRF